MKNIKLLVVITFTGLCFVGCKDDSKNTSTSKVKSETLAQVGKIETATFEISGMSCAVMCASKIEKELAGMNGVEKATVDFGKKTATVKYDNAKQSPEKFVEKVESIADGKTYKVSNLKSSANKAVLSFGDPEKEKKAAARKAKRAAKKAGTILTPVTEEKPGCCASKKHCSKDEKPGTL